jgi:Protein of unknown function (DUF2510)
MPSVSSEVPAGWYPDPSGARQWRVWNGTQWSDVTRSYGDRVASLSSLGEVDSPVASLHVIDSLRRLTQFGVVAYYAGFALLMGLIAHWPGHAHPVTARFASAALGAALGLILIGTISFAVSVHALEGRWTVGAVVPLVNTFVASYVMSRRIGLTAPEVRVAADAVITLGFVLLCASQPWVGVALAGVAFTQLARAYVLLDQFSGPVSTLT